MSEIVTNHHVISAWARVIKQVRAEMGRRKVHPCDVVVVVPYAQLMHEARSAWLHGCETSKGQAHFLPRFETTQNWSRSLGAPASDGDDLRMDAARDVLTSSSLLARSGLQEHQGVLSGRLMEAAWSLARLAAAQPPIERSRWSERLGETLDAGLEAAVFAAEAATGRIALAWAGSSDYPTDPVFAAKPGLLVMLEGFQTEPMTQALKNLQGDAAMVLALDSNDDAAETAQINLHAAQDSEDEAQRAAACVLAHLAAGRVPVGLVAQDRVLTRRVRSMLSDSGVLLRDETGWKLSTTRAAASLMSLLRAASWNASTDVVLDWLKNAPAFESSAVCELEVSLRRLGVRDWRDVPAGEALRGKVQALRDGLQAARSLTRWLADLRLALQGSGQWVGLLQDTAGQAVLDALRLDEGSEHEFADVTARMGQTEFTAWVGQTLEGGSFSPVHPPQAQVVILPLSQLLGRTLAAVVMPGCDEVRLPMSPEPPGSWTPEQRALLGLPSRDELAASTRASWHYALRFPHVDLLWRHSEGGEHLMASGFIQELMLQKAPELAPDPRVLRAMTAQPCLMPRPTGEALPLRRLSSTTYEDLRRCPYRFFALRQLKLKESDELDLELGKREFGNWLHQVLKYFHEALKGAPTVDLSARIGMINVAAEQATLALRLSPNEFLPFSAAWPRVRAGYLDWLAGHEADGASFLEGESWKEMALGHLTLVGKIDRIDRLADGSVMVMDYKTEAPSATARRLKDSTEDTQLPFYAALLTEDTLAAAYVNVGEKDGTKSYLQSDVVALRDQLLEGIATDMARIEAGALMPALGEGKACEFCTARGLCRKDFWESM